MRVYKNKDDVQKKSYFNDRFYVTPQVPKTSIYNDSTYSNDVSSLSKKVELLDAYIELGELVVWINHQDNVLAMTHIKEILAYDMLMELSAIDYISAKGGFDIFYEMVSTSKRKRIRIKTFIKKNQAIESVEPLFRMADWSEREMYDMFGIKVNNHPMLKRILMPEDWHDHPLLKTYPLQGDEAASWYEVDKIFGKEAREIVGKEIRDDSAIDRYDTTRFARLGHEVPYGTDIRDGKEPEHTPLAYQEDGGVRLFGSPRLVTKFDEDESITLKERR
jgi:NADH-quinone oxidoreductase subunit C